MVERPKVGEDTIDVYKGSGSLATENDILAGIDSISLEYEKLKKLENSKGTNYLNDQMWVEASLRGEVGVLADAIRQRIKYDENRKTQQEKLKSAGETERKILQNMGSSDDETSNDINAINKWNDYSAAKDYDGYILSLKLPTLNNTNKIDRIDSETGYNFGTYSDREWARLILNNTFSRYEAYQIEANKATQNFLVTIGAYLASAVNRVGAGVSQFCQDIYNIGEGLLNMFCNWSSDNGLGQRFLYAFQNDTNSYGADSSQPFAVLAEQLNQGAMDVERNYCQFYNVVDEYYGADDYSTVGRWYVSAFQSLGYMIPSMVLSAMTLGTSTGVTTGANVLSKTASIVGQTTFYAGVFSGNISDTLSAAADKGLSYKDLDAGEVIANAATKAAYQWAVEAALAKILGLSGLDKMLRGGKVATKTVTKIGKNELAGFGIAAARLGKDMIKEGTEEVLQDMSDGLVDYFFARQKTNLQEVYAESVPEKFNIQNLIDSFVVAAFTQLGTGLVDTAKFAISYANPDNRIAGATSSGKTYTLGVFQAMNFTEAMQTLNEYNATLNDDKASLHDKADAAFKMSVAIDTVGSIFANIGEDRAIAANNLLVGYLNDKAKKEEIGKLSNPIYARSLYDSFVKNFGQIQTKYKLDKFAAKIKKALEKKADKLKETGSSKIDNVVTSELNPDDPDINLPKESLKKVQAALSELGCEVILGTDGTLVTKSGDVIIVPNDLLVQGDIATIVKGIAYEQVQEAVKSNLSAAQKNLILSLYKQVTGLDADIDSAIQALLFDKKFYTKILLLSGERHYKNDAISLLVTIDKLIKSKAAKEVDKGNLTDKAYNVLMNKVYETMKAGVIAYATSYVNIDLDSVSAEVLPKDVKEVIRNHRNVIFTNAVNKGIQRAQKKGTIEDNEVNRYDYYIDKYADVIDEKTLAELKTKIRSKNYNDQLDAYAYLIAVAKASMDYDLSNTKLVYLVAPEEGRSVLEQGYVKSFEDYFGNTIKAFADDSYDVNKISEEGKQYIEARGYDLSNDSERNTACAAALYQLSKGTLTLDNKYNVCRVLNQEEFLDDRFLGSDGNEVFLTELKEGKIKTIKDVVKKNVKLPNYMKDIGIKFVTSDKIGTGAYKDGDGFIQIGAKGTTSTLMHELTHVVQYVANKNTVKGKSMVGGGSTSIFKSLPADVAQDLAQYLKDNFPLTYELITSFSNKYTYANVVYFLLQGELQANTIMATFLPNMGFKYKFNESGERILISPDGKKTWSLASPKVKSTYKIPATIAEAKARIAAKQDSDFNTIYEYGKKDAELSKTMPINDASTKVVNKYNTDPNKAFNYVLELTGTKRTSDYSQMLKAVQAADLNTSTLSDADRKLYQAGVMYLRNMAKYYKDLNTWMKSVESKMKASEKPAGPIEIDAKPNKSEILDAIESHEEPYSGARTKWFIDNHPDIREKIKGAWFTNWRGYQNLMYRGNTEDKLYDIHIDKDLNTKDWHFVYFSDRPFVSEKYIEGRKGAEVVMAFNTLKRSEMIFVDFKGNTWLDFEYAGPDVSLAYIHYSRNKEQDALLRREDWNAHKKVGVISTGDFISTDQLTNIIVYLHRDEFLNGTKKAIVYFNVNEVGEAGSSTDILLFDRNSIIPISKEDAEDIITNTDYDYDYNDEYEEEEAYLAKQKRVRERANDSAISKLKVGEMIYDENGRIIQKVKDVTLNPADLPTIKDKITANEKNTYYLSTDALKLSKLSSNYYYRNWLLVLNKWKASQRLSIPAELPEQVSVSDSIIYTNKNALINALNERPVSSAQRYYFDADKKEMYVVLTERQAIRTANQLAADISTNIISAPEGYTYDENSAQWYKNGEPVEGPIVNGKLVKSVYGLREELDKANISYDNPMTMPQAVRAENGKPTIRNHIKDSFFTTKLANDKLYQPIAYRAAWEAKYFDIQINKDLPTKNWKPIYLSYHPAVAAHLLTSTMSTDQKYQRKTEKEKLLRGFVNNLKPEEIVTVDFNGAAWSDYKYEGEPLPLDIIFFEKELDKKWFTSFANLSPDGTKFMSGTMLTTDYLVNVLCYLHKDEILAGKVKAFLLRNVNETGMKGDVNDDLVILDESVLMEVTKKDYGLYAKAVVKELGHNFTLPDFNEFNKDYIHSLEQSAMSNLSVGELAYDAAGTIYKKLDGPKSDLKKDESNIIKSDTGFEFVLSKLPLYDIGIKSMTRAKINSMRDQLPRFYDTSKMPKEAQDKVVAKALAERYNIYISKEELMEQLNTGTISDDAIYCTDQEMYRINPMARVARNRNLIENNLEQVRKPAGYNYDKFLDQWYDKNGKAIDKLVINGKEVKSVYSLMDELDEANVSYDEELKRSSRYISNEVARQSNLKYWIRKGTPIMVDPAIAKFVISTTKDFDQLPKILQRKIKKGLLTKFDIADYVATAAYIDDYTLSHIAKDIYNNSALAKITFTELRQLEQNIESLSTLAYTVDDQKKYKEMTPAQLLNLRTEINEKAKTDKELNKKLVKATYSSNTVYMTEEQRKNKTPEVVQVDDRQLNPVFFRHYNGTPESLRHINNVAKYNTAMQNFNPGSTGNEADVDGAVDAGDYGENGASTGKEKPWNWADRAKYADTVYEYDDVNKTLAIAPREHKLKTLSDYITDVITAKLKALPADIQAVNAKAAVRRLNEEIDKLNNLSDEELNKRYLAVLRKESTGNKDIEDTIAPYQDTKKGEDKSTKNRKDQVRNLLTDLTEKINGKVTRYKLLSNQVLLDKVVNKNLQEFLDGETFVRNPMMYKDMSDAELDTLIKDLKTANEFMKKAVGKMEIRKYGDELVQEKLARQSRRLKAEAKKEVKAEFEKKTLKEKLNYKYKTKIKEQTFEFVTPEKANNTVSSVLGTEFDKTRMSEVQGLSNNAEQDVISVNEFFARNADAIASADLKDIEDACRWFIQAKMNNITDAEFRKYSAIKLMFLTYVFSETQEGRAYADMNANLKQQIENAIKAEVSNAGTTNSVWSKVKNLVNPIEAMSNADMELDGVKIPQGEKTQFFDALASGDISRMKAAQQSLIDYVSSRKTAKKSILRKITTIRSISMLSGPLTWLRNRVSNMALKRLNKVFSKLGNAMFKNKTMAGQIKMTGKITPEIQEFITKNFIDNKFFDSFISNISKYNPSEISAKFKDINGKPTKEAIVVQLILKSMYNKYYNENMFKSKFMNSVYQQLMKVMSDDAYVREAAVRYFGKILAEKGYDFNQITEVNDNIMNDFATALGLALSDYMHSDNFFYTIEKAIASKSDLGWFAYKLFLPYAGASWNWFKAMIKMSPIGLARSLFQITRLEKTIAKAEADWAAGKSSINPELTEYIVRRDLGSGVIGTVAWALGILLGALGIIDLQDDDYGTPKIRIGNITVDVSSIFGTSSALAGAALVSGMKSKGVTWEGFLEGLNNTADFTLNSFPLMDIIEMDMYSDGGFSMGMDQLENIALSYIPNFISWIAGATYSGNVNKNTFWKRAIAKIPFMANFLPKKVNPYTGEEGTWWDAANRVIPYFSYTPTSSSESKSSQLGLNKTELKGKYTINGESFNLSDREKNAINKAYGQWNATDLEKFYKNQLSVKVKDTTTNTYKTMFYNQMTDYQRKTAVQTIMSNNAELAKIKAWVSAGNKYYASATMYTTLTSRGVRSNVYKGTKGFVKK